MRFDASGRRSVDFAKLRSSNLPHLTRRRVCPLQRVAKNVRTSPSPGLTARSRTQVPTALRGLMVKHPHRATTSRVPLRATSVLAVSSQIQEASATAPLGGTPTPGSSQSPITGGPSPGFPTPGGTRLPSVTTDPTTGYIPLRDHLLGLPTSTFYDDPR